MKEKCEWCGGDTAIRNPTGNCDHLYYPDYVNKSLKKEVSNTSTKERVEEQIDHKRATLIRAIKSIVPPPYLLDEAEMHEEIKNGRTGSMIVIENDRRQKQYENTIEQMYIYISRSLDQIEKETVERCIELIPEEKSVRQEETEVEERNILISIFGEAKSPEHLVERRTGFNICREMILSALNQLKK